MRTAGQVNLFLLGAVLLVALGGLFLFVGRNGPTDVANEWIPALAKGNVDKLADLTYLRGGDKEKLREEYKFATQVAAPSYSFTWTVRDEKTANDKSASVQISVWRNAMKQG